VEGSVLNKRTIESLVKAGACDSLGHPRKGLIDVHEQLIETTLARRRERDAGIMSLFADGVPEGADLGFEHRVAIPEGEYPKPQRLTFEKEMLGLYVSEHPLLGVERALARHVECTIGELRDLREGELRTVGGIVTSLVRRYTKKGDLMATFALEDLGAALEVMVFPHTMASCGHVLEDDAIVCVKGRVDQREEQPRLTALEITRPELVLDEGPPVRVRTKLASFDERRVAQVKEILIAHPGDSPVFVHLEAPERTTVLRLSDEYCVNASNGLYAELRILLGADCIA